MALFTPETARLMSARGNAAKAARLKVLRDAVNTPVPLPDLPGPDLYMLRRLARVRAQIDLLSDMVERERDPGKLDRLVNAIYRLQELERIIAGRPLPGSRRPAPEPREQGSSKQPAIPRAPDAKPTPNAPTPPTTPAPQQPSHSLTERPDFE